MLNPYQRRTIESAVVSNHSISLLPHRFQVMFAIEMANAMNASKENALKAQWEYYRELLHFDDIAEKALLGEAADA